MLTIMSGIGAATMQWRPSKFLLDAALLTTARSSVALSCRHVCQFGPPKTSIGPQRFPQIPGHQGDSFNATRRVNIATPGSTAFVSVSNLQLRRREMTISWYSPFNLLTSTISLNNLSRRSCTLPEATTVSPAWTRHHVRWHIQAATSFPQDPLHNVIMRRRPSKPRLKRCLQGMSTNPLSITHRVQSDTKQ